MPRIKEYFAPVKRIAPSEHGFEAAQALARSQEALGGSGERTAEAWVQAARRLGTLGTETAQMTRQTAELQARSIEGLRGEGHVEATRDTKSNIEAIRFEKNKPQRDPAAHREILRAAAATFSDGTKYPVDPNTGKPFSPDSWELYQRTRQLGAETDEAATKAGEKLPINPATGAPFTRATWQNAQWQRSYDQQQYVDQEHLHTLTQQQIAAQRQQDIEKATGQTLTQHDIQQWRLDIEKYNQFQGRQDPTQPDPRLPIDPRTQTADNPKGTNFTPDTMKQYNEASGFAGKQFNNQAVPGAPVAASPLATSSGQPAAPSVWDNIKSGVAAVGSGINYTTNPTTYGIGTSSVTDPGNVTLGNPAVQPALTPGTPTPIPDQTEQSLTSGNQ